MSHIGYKLLADNLIAKLEICKDGVNNESRESVVDVSHAKHRCSKAKVLEIYHAFTKERVNKGKSLTRTHKGLTYRVGEVIEVKDYDKKLNRICSTGIHYFLEEECALFYQRGKLKARGWNGTVKLWTDNGQLHSSYTLKDGVKSGPYQVFMGGHLLGKGSYKDGVNEGYYQRYHCCSNSLQEEGYYVGGKRHGEFKTYNTSGKLSVVINYKYGVTDGLCTTFWDDCVRHTNYKDGKEDGLEVEYFKDGRLKMERYYVYGRLHGVEREFSRDGRVKRVIEWENGVSTFRVKTRPTKKRIYKRKRDPIDSIFAKIFPKANSKRKF